MKPPIDPGKVHRKQVQVTKEDSAFFYALLEAQEGMTAYSTLPHTVGDRYREIELWIPDGFLTDVTEWLDSLDWVR